MKKLLSILLSFTLFFQFTSFPVFANGIHNEETSETADVLTENDQTDSTLESEDNDDSSLETSNGESSDDVELTQEATAEQNAHVEHLPDSETAENLEENVDKLDTDVATPENSTKESTINNDETTPAAPQVMTFSAVTQVSYSGIALKEPTYVYKQTNRNNGYWKSYEKGSILKYRSFSDNWYEATVYVNGQKKTGYIHKDDVENVNTTNQQNLRGIALQSPTKVFKRASTSADVWKSYEKGSILKYRTFSKNWYEATVIVNGKKRTGYIHKNHVQTVDTSNQKHYRGVALQNPTKVYQRVSTGSPVLKSYSKGSILKYRSFTSNWYEATVYVNGKRKTGYIHKNDVENAVETQQQLSGIGLNNPTAVYQRASTNSKALKTYSAGHVLKYRTFSSNWYEATVYINKKKHTGYIHKSHVESVVENYGKTVRALAAKDPTNAYATPSKNAKVLKTYKKFNLLKLKTLTKNWYEATVIINGKRQRAFFHVNDVTTENKVTTNYGISFDEYVDAVLKWGTPKWDGAGKFPAVREEVEYYAHPNSFPVGTPEYFQFLVLSQPAGLDPTELNKTILKGKGVLSDQGAAFVEAAKKHSINEIYLIQHALHETGNGTSTLAKGIPVDKNGNVIRDSEGNIDYDEYHPDYYKTVYNVFGYAAYDNDPINGGAKYAFDNGWFTIKEAIIGGAATIDNNWIKKGKDTLYKMKWSPTTPGTGQYATHVKWATSQAINIYNYYKNLNTYSLIFDIPQYKDLPPMQFGKVVTEKDPLTVRTGPSTSHGVVGSIPKGRIMKIHEKKDGWYRVTYDKYSGWVSGDFVSLLN